MVEIKIQRRDRIGRLRSIKRPEQIVSACERLGFRITHGGKHPFVARDPENTDDNDFSSSITVIQSRPSPNTNEAIFKEILNSPISIRMGITEDDIWKAFKIK